MSNGKNDSNETISSKTTQSNKEDTIQQNETINTEDLPIIIQKDLFGGKRTNNS